MPDLNVALSHFFLEELYMSEVSPYRDDHPGCEPDGKTDCHGNGGVHPVGDTWHETVAVIEEAYDRADAASLASYRRKHGADTHGRSAMRVRVVFPARLLKTLDDMLDNDIDKWSGWIEPGYDMSAGAYVKVGYMLRDKIHALIK